MTETNINEDINPFTASTDPAVQLTKESKLTQKLEQRDYLNMRAEDKALYQQSKNPKIKASDLRREDREIFGSYYPTKTNNLPPPVLSDLLPESFRPTRRDGIKQYINRQKDICRITFNSAMKESEIQSLNEQILQRQDYLREKEQELNRMEIEIEENTRIQDEKSLKINKVNEESQLKYESTNRKIDELRSCLASLIQEIQKQKLVLEKYINCRDLIEDVGKLSALADQVMILKNRRDVVVQYFDEKDNQVSLDRDQWLELCDYSVVQRDDQSEENQSKTGQSLQMSTKKIDKLSQSQFPKKYESQPGWSQPKVSTTQKKQLQMEKDKQKLQQMKSRQLDPYVIFRHPLVLELSNKYCSFGETSQVSEVKIDFNFNQFVQSLNDKLQFKLAFKEPNVVQTEKTSLASVIEANAKQVENVRLKCDLDNIFERFDLNIDNVDKTVVDSCSLLKDSYDFPIQIPFVNIDDFIGNLHLLEEGNLLRTQHLQDQQQLNENEENRLREQDSGFKKRETELEHNISEMERQVQELERQQKQRFNKESLSQQTEAFIYDLSKYSSQDELTLEKFSDELDVLNLAIINAGVYTGSIDQEDRNSNLDSNNVLAKMELKLNDVFHEFSRFENQPQLIIDAKRELQKLRRDSAKEQNKIRTEQKEAEKRERQHIREERMMREKLITRPVVVRHFAEDKRKTQVQMELEERVYNDALNSGKEADDFYAD